jgi:hypothetical protein
LAAAAKPGNKTDSKTSVKVSGLRRREKEDFIAV